MEKNTKGRKEQILLLTQSAWGGRKDAKRKGKKRKEDQDIFLTTEDTENTEKKGGRENGVIQDY